MANLYLDSYTDTWRESGHLEPSTPSAEDEFFAGSEPDTGPDWQDLMLAVESLTEKQRFVIQLRYGLRDGYRYTQAEIAKLMGISQQKVDALEKRGLATLSFLLRSPVSGSA